MPAERVSMRKIRDVLRLTHRPANRHRGGGEAERPGSSITTQRSTRTAKQKSATWPSTAPAARSLSWRRASRARNYEESGSPANLHRPGVEAERPGTSAPATGHHPAFDPDRESAKQKSATWPSTAPVARFLSWRRASRARNDEESG